MKNIERSKHLKQEIDILRKKYSVNEIAAKADIPVSTLYSFLTSMNNGKAVNLNWKTEGKLAETFTTFTEFDGDGEAVNDMASTPNEKQRLYTFDEIEKCCDVGASLNIKQFRSQAHYREVINQIFNIIWYAEKRGA